MGSLKRYNNMNDLNKGDLEWIWRKTIQLKGTGRIKVLRRQ